MKKIAERILSVFIVAVIIACSAPLSGIAGMDWAKLFKIEAKATTSTGGVTENNGHYYEFFQTKMQWKEAEVFCKNLGGHLVTITSQEEQDFIYSKFNSLIKKEGIAIGLTDEITEGDWRWVTGETFEYSNWDYGEPNNQGNEDYALMKTNGKWNDGHLEKEKWCFICEWEGLTEIKS